MAWIENPIITEYATAGVKYYEKGEQYYECEEDRRTKSWKSAASIAALGLITTYLYYAEYSDVVGKRKELNDKIYACALKEHEHWRDHTYTHTLAAFDWIYDLPEVSPNFSSPGSAPPSAAIASTLSNWAKGTDCYDCGTSSEVSAHAQLGGAIAANALVRNQQRRQEFRRELKVSGLGVLDKAGKNTAAPGRQAMGVGLNLINTLVAMASSGVNGGLNMLGRGLGDLGNSGLGSDR